MSTGSLKQRLFAQLAVLGKALSNGNRLELLELLAQGERNVETLAGMAGLSVANASQHLQRLSRAGLVVGRKDGQHVLYRLADPRVVDLLTAMRGIAESHLAELERLIAHDLKAMDGLEAVPADMLLERLRGGTVTVIDVRPPTEYRTGHLPGAVNIPLDELERSLEKLPAGREVVAYCRGPYCVLAYEAVKRLREQGFRALRLENGFPEWKQAGLPVETFRSAGADSA